MLPVRFVAVRIVSHFRLVASLHFHSTFTTSISAPPRGNTSPITFYELFSGSTKMKAELLFKRLTDKAFVPTKGSERAAGFDLKSAYSVVVPAKGKALCMTDLQIRVPSGCYGRIAPRSGLAVKHFIDVGAGVIDEDYTGNVGVVLFNHSNEDFKVNEGDRIAQLICEMICYPELKEVKELAETARGDGGFGSTGQN